MAGAPGTWTRGLCTFVVLGVTACECDDRAALASLSLTAPADNALLTLLAHDTDAERAGLQYDVVGEAERIAVGTRIDLYIDGVRQGVSGEVDDLGRVQLPNVTLKPGTHNIFLQTAVGSVNSNDRQQYTLRALEFAAPAHGSTLSEIDDEDASVEGLQISVIVDAFALPLDQEVALLLDGEEVGLGTLGAQGRATFGNVTLASGLHTLKAVSGEGDERIVSDEIEIDVRESCAAVSFVSPALPATGDVVLGGSGSCPSAPEPFTTRIEVMADTRDGRRASLIVNATPVAEGEVMGGHVAFDGVVLPNASNTLAVDVENDDGTTCRTSFAANVRVDCTGPDCFIRAPIPRVFVGNDDETTLYLGEGQLSGDGFTVEVESDADTAGSLVELIVDGADDDPLEADAEAVNDDAVAIFAALELTEGAHTVEALCRDAAGNVSSSGELEVVVDTQGCSVDVSDPVGGSLLVPADDEDGSSMGIQVVTTSVLTGDDCVARRVAVCDPEQGITDADFVTHDGSETLLAPATLDQDQDEQSLCIEVLDRAGNRGIGSVEVRLRDDPPNVLIEEPIEDSAFSALGDDDHEADAVPGTAECDAELSIACELGESVSLRHDGTSGSVIATADCEERDSSDPVLPTGYSGRAKLTAPIGDGDQSVVLVATQSVAGSSGALLAGVSPMLSLSADCAPPELAVPSGPCSSTAAHQVSAATAASFVLQVGDTTMDLAAASLEVTNTGGTTGPFAAGNVTASFASFSGIDLGGIGMVTITVQGLDDFGNAASFECELEVVTAVVSETELAIEPPPAPELSSTTHRDGVTAGWSEPIGDIATQLDHYELRCQSTALPSDAGEPAKQNWWDAAAVVDLPVDLTPDDIDPSTLLAFRPEEPRHCVVRGFTGAGEGTLIGASTDLTLRLRQVVISPGAADALVGYMVQPAGDVDGDGLQDVLASGFGRAELHFGSDTATTPFDATADVVLVTDDTPADAEYPVSVAPIGDFNGDSLDDFAVLDLSWNGFDGQVWIFFGRPRGDWLGATPIDLSSGCNADLCLTHDVALASLADVGAAIGDFDDDGLSDLAIGNSWFPADYDGQLLIVRGGSYQARDCVDDNDCRAQESCVGAPAGTCALDGGEIFWRLEISVPSGNYVGTEPPGESSPVLSGFVLDTALGSGGGLGMTLGAIGDYDGTDGTELVVSAPLAGEVHLLSGRAHSGAPGFDALTEADLGLRDGVSGPTDGLPIATGSPASSYGSVLAALGSFYDPAGAFDSGRVDLAISTTSASVDDDDLFVVPGELAASTDLGFSAAEAHGLREGSGLGQAIASADQPALGLYGDLDGDGEPELCAGTESLDQLVLFYADTFGAAVSANELDVSQGLRIALAATTPSSTRLVPQYVGDANGDGHLDLVVGDPFATSNTGQVILLY